MRGMGGEEGRRVWEITMLISGLFHFLFALLLFLCAIKKDLVQSMHNQTIPIHNYEHVLTCCFTEFWLNTDTSSDQFSNLVWLSQVDSSFLTAQNRDLHICTYAYILYIIG